MAAVASARPPTWPRRGRSVALIAVLFAALALGCWLDARPASAQVQGGLLSFPVMPPRIKPSPGTAAHHRQSEQAPMLLQATEMHYDYSNKRVSAVGNVQIYHGGTTLEANKVIYDETTKRLHAEGNVRLTEPDGKVTYGEIMNLSDDFRDGFVDSLRLDAPDQTRMAATRADRGSGNFTVFHSGVYTACEPCREDPRKPPLWQVSAARIIHDEGEKMIYFENARLEFFGRPIAYLPYLSAPDPTVKRKSGFLMPLFSYSSKYGYAAEVPYYWALSPNYDITFLPMITSRQGPLMQAEYRQRFENGQLMVRGAGIYQLDKGAFLRDPNNVDTATPGYRDFRGSIETSGQFALNKKWVWGFDGVAPTDPTFFQDYNLSAYRYNLDPFRTGYVTEGVSQLYLVGRGDRSYFDTRAIYYYGFSEADIQKQLPVIHPVMDYNYVFAQPVYGGELSYNVNLTSLSRAIGSFDAISQTAVQTGACLPATADPAQKIPANCLLRGAPGVYTRLSAEANWRRTYTDAFGQVFTPFMRVRGDAASFHITAEPGVSNYIATGDHTELRAMPTAGLEYRYPFINVNSWGTQTIEPIAQVIVRPDEPRIGKLPIEDAQSLIFDDGNLFRIDKFSGYDRMEGGSRANVGVQYTTQFNRGGFVNAMFGQSYHLFGTNSFAVGDATNTGLGSGLDKARSDYVARLSYQPDRTYMFTTRYRFDDDTFRVRRFEAEGRATFDRWTFLAMYGNYDAQPELGFLTRREGVLALTQFKLHQNWVVWGLTRYDIDSHKFDMSQFGIGYMDDCLILGMSYMKSYTLSGNAQVDNRIMLQLSLRTLGSTSFNQTVGGLDRPGPLASTAQ